MFDENKLLKMYHRGPYIQRGRGLGNFLGQLLNSFRPTAAALAEKVVNSPITKKILKTAKRSALEAGLNIATDVLGEKKKIATSVGENVSSAKRAIAKSLAEAKPDILGVASKGKKRGGLKETPRAKRRRKRGDIFDQKF
jgi:hypothetical protein